MQTTAGKLVLLAAFGFGLRFFDPYVAVLQFVAVLALITFMPEYRRFVLALSPLCLLLIQSGPLSTAHWPEVRHGGNRPVAFFYSKALAKVMVWPKANRVSAFWVQRLLIAVACFCRPAHLVVSRPLEFDRSLQGELRPGLSVTP